MATKNNYSDISRETTGYAVKRLLKRGQPILIFERFGQVDPQGKNKTKTRSYRRYRALPLATAPLAEGVTPAGQQLTWDDIEVQLEQYGDLVWTSDVVLDTHTDPILRVSSDLCGEQAGETCEVVRGAVLKSGTNVFYASGVAGRGTVNAAPTVNDLRAIYRAMMRNRARPISRLIKASADYGTEPVAPAYFGIGHTDLDAGFKALTTGFTPVEKYANGGKGMLESEIGKVESVRVCLTNTDALGPWEETGASGTTYLSGGVKVSDAAACDVYPLLVTARDSYGIVPMSGMNGAEVFVHNPKPDTNDPLAQKGFVSWKRWDGCVILNHLWLARLEAAALAL